MKKVERSDALVFFGASGDLAYKKIFPALHGMARRNRLDVPVVGVARTKWSLEQFRERARASIEEHGGGLDEAEVSAFVSSLTGLDANSLKKLKHLDSLVNNLEDKDNNLSQKLEQLQSLIGGLTDRFNNFLQKLEQPQPIVLPADISSE